MPTGWPPRDLIATHLFRALLREISYLPDPVAKTYFKQHTVTRFRQYWVHKPHEAPKVPPTPERHVHVLKAARKGLSILFRANNGRSKELYKVLAYAYGRSGRRRRHLIDALQTPEASIDTAVSRATETKDVASGAVVPRLTPQAEAIAKSQKSLGITRENRALVKRTRPKIPEKNAWMRPMPLVRVKNLTAKWYASTLERLFPPLPEWDHRLLQSLASGEYLWSAPTYRARSARAKIGEVKDDEKGSIGNARRTRPIPRRKMERVWSKVLAQCPSLTWNEKKLVWTVTWGAVGRCSHEDPTVPTVNQLFEGVDEHGNISRPKIPSKPPERKTEQD